MMRRLNPALLILLPFVSYSLYDPRPARASVFTVDEPMTFQRQRLPDHLCFGRCPEWIAAEGDILPTTTAALRQALDANPDIRVLLVNSAGGSVEAAIAMARLLRSRRMNVLVAASVAVDCERFGLSCGPGVPEYAEPLRGDCESACIPLLAGGVQRAAWPDANLRVHRYRQVRYERTKKATGTLVRLGPELFSKAGYAPTENHLKAMGISDDIIQLIRSTPVFPMACIDQNLAIRSRLINVDHGRTLLSNWERRTRTVDGVPIVARLSLKYSAQPQTYFRFVIKAGGHAESTAFLVDSLGVLKPDQMELRFGSTTIPNVAGGGVRDGPTISLTEICKEEGSENPSLELWKTGQGPTLIARGKFVSTSDICALRQGR